MIRNVMIVFAVAVLIGLGALAASRMHSTPDDRLLVFGNIEVTEVDVSFKLPGKVKKRFVDEGELVKKGQPVAELELDELIHERSLQLGKVKEAKASLQEIQTGALPKDIAQLEAQVEAARADFERIREDFMRQKQLLRDEVISQKEYDVSQSAFIAAEASLKQFQESYELTVGPIQNLRLEGAVSRVNQAIASLGIAENHLQDAFLTSPLDGWVISKNIESGEVVAAGTPIVTVGNLNDIWFRAYVDESDLGKIKLNQRVQVTTDSYPEKIYEGTISFISKQAEFTPKNVETKKERVKLVYRIKVALDNQSLELRPGMPAEGVIFLQ